MQQRMEALEKRMEKQEELLEAVSNAVIRLEANGEGLTRWTTLAISLATAVGGVLLGHFLH